MPKEEFQLRIRKDGTIVLNTQDLGPEGLRRLKEMLKDCIGPVTIETDPDSGGAVVIVSDKEKVLRLKRDG